MSVAGKILGLVLTVSIIILILAPDANAYIDPATGSYILQILLAGLLGALFALKVFWRNIKGFLSRILSRSGQNNVEAD